MESNNIHPVRDISTGRDCHAPPVRAGLAMTSLRGSPALGGIKSTTEAISISNGVHSKEMNSAETVSIRRSGTNSTETALANSTETALAKMSMREILRHRNTET